MTVQIVQITDFSAIEDAIATWFKTGTGLPNDSKGGRAIYWEGSRFKRERPYGLMTPISQPTPGQPWGSKGLNGSTYDTIYYQPFRWNIQFSVYVDSYDSDGKKIRVTAYRYMQNLINRSFIPSVKNILSAVNLSFNPQTETIQPNVITASDDDKYIQQATLEYMFSGIAVTTEKDTDYFTSITTPTEENGGLTLSEV